MTDSSRPLGVAIVGSGMISEFQARAILDLPMARLIGFQDTVSELARKRAEQYAARCYSDLRDLLCDEAVDIVSICTPSGSHLEPAVEAARAGKHVMVEKPVEITTERIDRIIDACRESGVTLGAIFPRRFMDTSRLLKRAIDGGRFGILSLADVYIKWYRSQEYYDSGGWRGTWELDGGGALMNQGIHGIDLIQWLMGGVESVAGMVATRSHERIEVEDAATASVRYRCGSLGVIEATTAAWPGAKIRIEISGSAGTVIMEDETILAWSFADESEEDAAIRREYGPREGLSGGGAADPKAISSEGHRRQFEDFICAIREGRAPFCDGREGRAAVDVITSIYRSAREGRAIQLA
ncbi:MAG: Gfo/Idh/MocA family oxidoreductase [Planctomycetes bacterium]|nr:Gfo/Idh/MocA family oxidoreductase [Planctomycetota bacterium]